MSNYHFTLYFFKNILPLTKTHGGTIKQKRIALFALFLLLTFHASPVLTQNADLVKVSDNIYAFIPPDPCKDYVDGNSVMIITPGGLVIIDTRTDYISAKTEIAEIKKLTSLPVKYIINTHWHYDHILGNEEFKKEWPDAVIIVHRDCLKQMEENVPRALALEPGASKDLIQQFTGELSSGIGGDGNPLSEYDKIRHKQTIADVEEYIKYPIPKYVKPDVIFDSSITIYPGGMEIQISRWGNGHTIGDAMVWLPVEKVLISGDNVVAPVPYTLGNYVKAQTEILNRILQLDLSVIIPGHGKVQFDKKYISSLISLFNSAEEKVIECYNKGMTVDECLKSVNFDEFKQQYVTDEESAYAFKNYFAQPVIRAIYKNELNVK